MANYIGKIDYVKRKTAYFNVKNAESREIYKKVLTNKEKSVILSRLLWAVAHDYGGIAQLARASGSYPAGRWFKSDFRY